MGAAEGMIIFFLVLIGIGVALVPMIFYLITMQNTLKAISDENRRMPPGEVWLMLIPLFGMVWQFIMVNRMADSLRPEFDRLGIVEPEQRPGAGIGLAFCILNVCSIIPFLGYLSALGGIVCWIIYWVKIAGFKNKLIATQWPQQNQPQQVQQQSQQQAQ